MQDGSDLSPLHGPVVLMLDPRPAKFPKEFALVVANSRSGILDEIGTFRPTSPDPRLRLVVDEEKLASWKESGAEIPDLIRKLLIVYGSGDGISHNGNGATHSPSGEEANPS